MFNLQTFFHLPAIPAQPIIAGPYDVPRAQSPSNANLLGTRILDSPWGNQFDEEFDGPEFPRRWRHFGIAPTFESFDDKIRSAWFMQIAASAGYVGIFRPVQIPGDFSMTFCTSFENTGEANYFWGFYLADSATANAVILQSMYSSGAKIRSSKIVATVQTAVDTTATLTYDLSMSYTLLHIQRSGNNWTFYYSCDGVTWNKLATTVALTFSVEKIVISGGTNAAVKTQMALHWLRTNWITIA